MVNAVTGVSEPRSAASSAEPLTLEFPRIVLPDVAAPVLGTGRPGSRVAVALFSDLEKRDFGFVLRFVLWVFLKSTSAMNHVHAW